jgi:diadenosine tetraphosphate (Ap4A) HIT family hydrolase
MQLHPRLEADCHRLGSLKSGILLLHKNASLPWFIFVPFTDAVALYQIEGEKRADIEREWNDLAAWVHKRYECKRVNVAAIGNLVPQLHLHIVARTESDPCWPGVVWGQDLPEASWQDGTLQDIKNSLELDFNFNIACDQ